MDRSVLAYINKTSPRFSLRYKVFLFLTKLLVISITLSNTGCWLKKNAKNIEVNERLMAIHNSQGLYRKTNGKYAQTMWDLGINKTQSKSGFYFGFNPKCSDTPPQLDKDTEKFFGTTHKTYFSTWVLKQPCRSNGFSAYAVRQLDSNSFEIYEINEKKLINFYKL
jgi:hypothetical protein